MLRLIAIILSITRWLCLPIAAVALALGAEQELFGLRRWSAEPKGELLFAATIVLATGWLWMGFLADAIRQPHRIWTPIYLALALLIAGAPFQAFWG